MMQYKEQESLQLNLDQGNQSLLPVWKLKLILLIHVHKLHELLSHEQCKLRVCICNKTELILSQSMMFIPKPNQAVLLNDQPKCNCVTKVSRHCSLSVSKLHQVWDSNKNKTESSNTAMYHLKVMKNMFLCLSFSDPYMQGSDRCDTKGSGYVHWS